MQCIYAIDTHASHMRFTLSTMIFAVHHLRMGWIFHWEGEREHRDYSQLLLTFCDDGDDECHINRRCRWISDLVKLVLSFSVDTECHCKLSVLFLCLSLVHRSRRKYFSFAFVVKTNETNFVNMTKLSLIIATSFIVQVRVALFFPLNRRFSFGQ